MEIPRIIQYLRILYTNKSFTISIFWEKEELMGCNQYDQRYIVRVTNEPEIVNSQLAILQTVYDNIYKILTY